jgi:hypothetical protein
MFSPLKLALIFAALTGFRIKEALSNKQQPKLLPVTTNQGGVPCPRKCECQQMDPLNFLQDTDGAREVCKFFPFNKFIYNN